MTNDIIQHIRQPHRSSQHEKFIKSMERQTSDFLKQHPKLIVIDSDKRNKTVIMDRDEYHRKAQQHLADTHVYHKNHEPKQRITCLIEIRNNKFIQKMPSERQIDEHEARTLTSEGGITPRTYMTIKTHKAGHPVRPVVSTPGSPTYKLTGFLQDVLITVPNDPELNIKNSLELKDLLDKIVFKPKLHLGIL